MAKLARNRQMFFASWTGTSITESATATKSGTGISAVTVTASTFGDAVSDTSGTYAFNYSGSAWKYNGTTVTLSSYGLEVTGTPVSGDKITVEYVAASGGWEALGKDDDDLSKALNPDTEKKKNVLGETAFTHKGYEPEIDVDTYYADPSRILYSHLLDVAMQEKYSEEDLLGYFAEAHFDTVDETARTMSGECYVRRAWLVPQSVGGDTSGLGLPFNITPTGGMTHGTIVYSMATNVATITLDSST
jgi:hypothetical protein